MKIKQFPDDFQVDELTFVIPSTLGEYALYRLDKINWTTLDALGVVRRRWHIDESRISYGGLKDRHATTKQYFTIFRGPQRALNQQGINVRYLGQVPRPFLAEDIQANRFHLTIRDLSSANLADIETNSRVLATVGVPNYFDDQRFGSLGPSKRFVVPFLLAEDYETALRLALIEPYEHDRRDGKLEKRILRRYWGNWAAAKSELPRGHARSVVDYLLTHPTDYRGAVARLKPELRSLYLSAYQSHLWNLTLRSWLERHVPSEEHRWVDLRPGPVPFPNVPPTGDGWESLTIPLPSARLKMRGDEAWAEALQNVLATEGIALEKLRIKAFDKPFFAKGDRAAFLRPTGILRRTLPDERHPGRHKLTLTFELPRGAYATMIIKRLTLPTHR